MKIGTNCKFRETHATNTPLRGIYIPKVDQISVKLSVLGVLSSIPLSLHRWGLNLDHLCMPNFTPIGATCRKNSG